jgi:hypothetical protein
VAQVIRAEVARVDRCGVMPHPLRAKAPARTGPAWATSAHGRRALASGCIGWAGDASVTEGLGLLDGTREAERMSDRAAAPETQEETSRDEERTESTAGSWRPRRDLLAVDVATAVVPVRTACRFNCRDGR